MLEKNKIQEFIDLVIEKAGFNNMPVDFLDEYSDRLTQEAYKRMGIAVMDELAVEKIEEFNELSEREGDNNEVINEFLKANIENFEEKMAEVLREFAEEVIKKAQELG